MRDSKGFTLIEIIAVVIIIGVLALIVVPSVSSYILNSRKTAYNAHELAMEEAAKEMTVEVIEGTDDFVLPRKGNYKNVFLKELIDKEFIKELQDPQTGKKCNEDMSYVIITGKTDTSYTYKACLYCGGYVTESDECVGSSTDDSTPPICGNITGESSEWTNKSRTITVECSDPDSGCKRSRYSQTFNSTMERGEISIYNSANVETKCPVTVKVDKNKPTCELQIDGDGTTESTGWTSGRNVVIKMISYTDGANESGVATYGMGTSSKKPNYNAQTSYEILNVSGTTTVFGYVKDKAGNEGMCYTTVTTGLEKPVFDVRYGYQIYPEKERFSTSNVSITDTNKLKTSASGDPTITFNHMAKYTNVTAVIIDLITEVSDPTSWKLSVGGTSYTADAESTTRLRFNIETEPALNSVSSSDTYVLKLGSEPNKEYQIDRIEIEQRTGNILSRYQVAVNLRTRKQVVRTTKWSWDNGSNWKTKYYDKFTITSSSKSGIARIKNDIPLTSEPKEYSIVKGDAVVPTISVSKNPSDWTNQNVTITSSLSDDNSGLIGYALSNSTSLSYYDTAWQYYDSPQTGTKTITDSASKNGNYYLYAKDEAGNVKYEKVEITNIDKLKPTCNAISSNGATATLSCSDPAATDDYAQSKINKYYFGTKSNPSDSDFTSTTATATFSKTETISGGNTYYLFVKDRAGNISDVKSDTYYTVTLNGNGATTAGSTSAIVRYKAKALSTITNPKREYTVSFDINSSGGTASSLETKKATYTLNGWYTATSSGSKVASNSTTPALQASVSGYTNSSSEWTKTSGATLYAQWTSASVTLPKITRANYTCKWNTKSDGTGTAYTGETSYTPTANVTLYAVCKSETGYLMATPLNSYVFNGSVLTSEVETITTVNHINVPSNAITSWDVSEQQNETVIAWVFDEDNNGLYELYIGEKNGVIANPNSKRTFAFYNNVKSIDLSNFKTSLATTMEEMFYKTAYSTKTNSNTYTLTITGLSNFDTSKVTNMQSMFYGTGAFKYKEFSGCDSSYYGEPAGTATFGDLSSWDVSNVTNMKDMFNEAGICSTSFVLGNLKNWNVSKVTDMSNMFYKSGKYADTWSIGDLGNWNVSKVTDFSYFMNEAAKKTTGYWDIGDLSRWNVSSATNMSHMFSSTPKKNATTWSVGNLNNWNVSKVTDFSYMFGLTDAENWSVGDISNWNVSSATNMDDMFVNAGESSNTFNLGNIGKWNVSKVESFKYFLGRAGHNATTYYVGDLSNWNVSKVKYFDNMFWSTGYSVNDFNIGDLSRWNVSSCTSFSSMFRDAGYSSNTFNLGNLGSWDMSNATTISLMFWFSGHKSSSWYIGDLSRWNVSNVTTMDMAFGNTGTKATSWSVGDLSNWNVSKVTDMSHMFEDSSYKATTFDVGNIGKWDVSNVTNMSHMFSNTGYLGEVTRWYIGDLSNWNVSKVVYMDDMFQNAAKSYIFNIGDISNWNTSNVEKMDGMFYGSGGKNTTWYVGNIGKWDVSKVKLMGSMFAYTAENATTFDLGDLKDWNTVNAWYMHSMFYKTASKATTWKIGTLNIYKDAQLDRMFSYTRNATCTINLRGAVKYNKAYESYLPFYNAAENGSGITVNYTSDANVDEIVAAKTDLSKVYKGSLIS